MTQTAIEWTDATWNPTTGCDRVSPGCDDSFTFRTPCPAPGQSATDVHSSDDWLCPA